MKAILKIGSALVLMIIILGPAFVVAASTSNADYDADYWFTVDDDVLDDVIVDDDDTNNDTDNEDIVYLRGRGTLFAMGNGRAEIRGTGSVLVFAEEANVIVSSNAWVRALGDWNVEYLGNGKVKYTGSGVLQIRGRHMTVDISGNDISLRASGRGSVTLKGNWDYWTIHWPRPWCCARVTAQCCHEYLYSCCVNAAGQTCQPSLQQLSYAGAMVKSSE